MKGQPIKDLWVLHLNSQADAIYLLTLISHFINEEIDKVKMQRSKNQYGK